MSKTRTTQSIRAAGAADAIGLLTHDHKEVDSLFKDYAKLVGKDRSGDVRQPLAEQICMMLTVHAAIEEEIFYPAALAAEVDANLLNEADVEHASVMDLIGQIGGMDPADPLYDAKVMVLGEYVAHHVKEEQDEMFPKCRKSGMDLQGLGVQIAARKEDLMSEMSEGTVAAD